MLKMVENVKNTMHGSAFTRKYIYIISYTNGSEVGYIIFKLTLLKIGKPLGLASGA